MNNVLLNFLIEYSAILKDTFELSEVTEAIIRKTADIFNSEGASLLLLDKESNVLKFQSSYNINEGVSSQLSHISVPVGEGIAGRVALTGQSVKVDNTEKDSRFEGNTDKKTHFQTRCLIASPVIIKDDLLGVIEVVNRKDRAFDDNDVRYLEVIGTIVAVFIEKAILSSSKIALTRFEKELEIARDLQSGMMPPLPMELAHYSLNGESSPSSGVGGDFWEVIDFGYEGTLLLLGDVSGHGLRAGLVMSAVRTALKTLAIEHENHKTVIKVLNELLYNEFGRRGIYTTFMFCWMQNNTIELLSAGHVNPVIHKNNQCSILKLPAGHPVGILPERREDKWTPCHLEPGDSIFFFTDGIEDGFSEEDFSIESLLSSTSCSVNLIDTREFFNHLQQTMNWKNVDDATILRLKKN